MVGRLEVEDAEVRDDVAEVVEAARRAERAARSYPMPLTTSTFSTNTLGEWLGIQ